MRIPSISITLLSISLLPTTLAEYVSYDIAPGKILSGTPGSLIPSKPDVSKRSLPRLSDNKPLPRWIPRSMDKNLQMRQVQAFGSGATGLICTSDGPTCGANAFCNSGLGCCLRGQTGCGRNSCCSEGESCCTAGGGCCPSGYNCVQIRGRSGCCLDGTDCDNVGDLVNTIEGIANPNDGGACQNQGFGVCPSRTFCCPAGRKCLRNADGQAACERVCEDSNFFVCPSNDFCCPQGSVCFVDDNGRSRCKVTIVTTITAGETPTATVTTPSPDPTTSDEPTTTPPPEKTESTSTEDQTSTSSEESANETTSSPAETTTSDFSFLPDPTETLVETSSTTDSAAEATSTVPGGAVRDDNEITGPLPPPNGGLDNIFTNGAIGGPDFPLPILLGVILGFVGFAVGML